MGKLNHWSIQELVKKHWKINKVLHVVFFQRTDSPESDHFDEQVQQARKFTEKKQHNHTMWLKSKINVT